MPKRGAGARQRHGADEIPGARPLTLEGAGHGVDQADWETIVPAVLEHTAQVHAAKEG